MQLARLDGDKSQNGLPECMSLVVLACERGLARQSILRGRRQILSLARSNFSSCMGSRDQQTPPLQPRGGGQLSHCRLDRTREWMASQKISLLCADILSPKLLLELIDDDQERGSHLLSTRFASPERRCALRTSRMAHQKSIVSYFHSQTRLSWDADGACALDYLPRTHTHTHTSERWQQVG